MKGMEAGSITLAQGDPPRIRGPWEDAIIGLVEKGDRRFRKILAGHVKSGVIRGERAMRALDGFEDVAA